MSFPGGDFSRSDRTYLIKIEHSGVSWSDNFSYFAFGRFVRGKIPKNTTAGGSLFEILSFGSAFFAGSIFQSHLCIDGFDLEIPRIFVCPACCLHRIGY